MTTMENPMRRILALAFITLSTPIVLLTTAGTASADPLPVIGGGPQKRICVVWYGSQDDSTTANVGEYCITY